MTITPAWLNKADAATYIGKSGDTIQKLTATGVLVPPVPRLEAVVPPSGLGRPHGELPHRTPEGVMNPTPKRTYIPGEGYVLVQPRPRVFISVQGPKGSRGNTPYVRPGAASTSA